MEIPLFIFISFLCYQILLERGRVGAKTRLIVSSTVPPNLRECLVPEKEFWTATKTLSFLADGPYFKEEGQDDLQWPQVLKDMMEEGKFVTSFVAV